MLNSKINEIQLHIKNDNLSLDKILDLILLIDKISQYVEVPATCQVTILPKQNDDFIRFLQNDNEIKQTN